MESQLQLMRFKKKLSPRLQLFSAADSMRATGSRQDEVKEPG